MIGWPASLWLVRHGESEGNVARARAYRSQALRMEISVNDMTVPLSPLGRQQAAALGRWIGAGEAGPAPTLAVVSPYVRARQTLHGVLQAAGLADLPVEVDERLRDREQGWLDSYTGAGISASFPEEHERRQHFGKFWYRPPGGESWADVAQRVRAFLLELRLTHDDQRVLLITHDVPLILTRYVLERLSAEEALALSGGRVRNCSLTCYEREPDGMVLSRFNDVTALRTEGLLTDPD